MSRDWKDYVGPFRVREDVKYQGNLLHAEIVGEDGVGILRMNGPMTQERASIICSCLNQAWYADHPTEGKDESK